VKCYLIQRTVDGKLRLTCQALVKGKVVETFPAGPFSIGDASKKTKALALEIMRHYYGASEGKGDPGAEYEAQRKAEAFLGAFLIHHAMPPGAQYEISSDVIDRWTFLLQIPVAAK
jgi:hypothetical protein